MILKAETEAEFAAALDQAIETPVCVQVPAEGAAVFGLDDHGPESAEAADVEGCPWLDLVAGAETPPTT